MEFYLDCLRTITYRLVTPTILFFCIAETCAALKRCVDMGGNSRGPRLNSLHSTLRVSNWAGRSRRSEVGNRLTEVRNRKSEIGNCIRPENRDRPQKKKQVSVGFKGNQKSMVNLMTAE